MEKILKDDEDCNIMLIRKTLGVSSSGLEFLPFTLQ